MKPGLYLCVGCVCVFVYLVVLCGVSGIIIFEEMEKKNNVLPKVLTFVSGSKGLTK